MMPNPAIKLFIRVKHPANYSCCWWASPPTHGLTRTCAWMGVQIQMQVMLGACQELTASCFSIQAASVLSRGGLLLLKALIPTNYSRQISKGRQVKQASCEQVCVFVNGTLCCKFLEVWKSEKVVSHRITSVNSHGIVDEKKGPYSLHLFKTET